MWLIFVCRCSSYRTYKDKKIRTYSKENLLAGSDGTSALQIVYGKGDGPKQPSPLRIVCLLRIPVVPIHKPEYGVVIGGSDQSEDFGLLIVNFHMLYSFGLSATGRMVAP